MNVEGPVGVNHDFVHDIAVEGVVPFLTRGERMNVAADILHEFGLVRQQLCAGFFFCQLFLEGKLFFIEPLNPFLVLRRFDIARQTHIQQLLLFALDLLQFALEVVGVALLRTGFQHVAHRAENAFQQAFPVLHDLSDDILQNVADVAVVKVAAVASHFIVAADDSLDAAFPLLFDASPDFVGRTVARLALHMDEGGTAFAADDFARQRIAIGKTVLGGVKLVPPFDFPLCRLEHLSGNDRLVVIADGDKFHFSVIIFLAMGEIVGSEGLLLHQIAAVFFVLQYAENDGVRPALHVGRCADSGFTQFLRDDVGSLAFIEILMKNQPHDFRAFFVDMKFTVPHIVAQHIAPEDNSLFHAPTVSPFDALGCAAAFLLRDGGHDGESKLRVRFEGVDVVVHEDHADAHCLELPGVADAVQHVAGEAGNLLGQNEVEFVILRVLDHAVEGGAFLRSGAAHALVHINFVKLPQRVAANVLVEIPLLAFQRIGLVEIVRGHTAIGGYPLDLIVE